MQFKPDSLFQRFFLIIVVPILILQITTSFIFYKKHWETVSDRMKEALLADFTAIIFHLKDNVKGLEEAQRVATILGVKIHYHSKKQIDDIIEYPIYTDRDLNNFSKLLDEKIPYKSKVFYDKNSHMISTLFELKHGVLEFDYSHKKFQSPTISIFLSWVVGSAILLIIISVIFMKNQVRSIVNLTKAAELLGKGQEIGEFKPSGASEIRKAGFAFIRMKQRIERQINYRSQLLSHISHDLRTPLTRIKLQLAMLKDKSAAKDMQNDVAEIEQMAISYLNFAKEEGNEKPMQIDVISLISEVVENLKSPKIELNLQSNSHIMKIRRDAFSRAFTNIIENALKHCKETVLVKAYKRNNNIYISVDDDGSGIPKEEYNKVFQPFYKSSGSKGFGLGLAIVKTIIYSHGGRIKLYRSSLGGLKMKIKLPL